MLTTGWTWNMKKNWKVTIMYFMSFRIDSITRLMIVPKISYNTTQISQSLLFPLSHLSMLPTILPTCIIIYSPQVSWWFDLAPWMRTVSLTFTVTSEVADDELLPSSDTPLFKCFGIDWVELCDMWEGLCDETCESSARMLVTVEGCEGGTRGGWSCCCVNCVRGTWERVGVGRAAGTSGTPV